MRYQHGVAWLDGHEAKVYLFDRGEAETASHPTQIQRHRRHRDSDHAAGKQPSLDVIFFDNILHALEPATEWLICGPGWAKSDFIRHIEAHAAQLCPRIVGVANAGHTSDDEMMVHARSYFRDADRMLRPLG